MKKLTPVLALILCLSILFLTACGPAGGKDTDKPSDTADTEASESPKTTEAPEDTDGADADDIKIGSLEDLEGKVIGVQLGTIGDEIASDDINAKSVERFTTYVDAVTSLKQKKVDCLVVDADTAQAYADQNPELTVLDVGFDPEEYAVAVAKEGSEDLLAAINETIAELKADGSIIKFKDSHAGQNGKAPDFNVGAAGGILIVGTEPTFPPYEYTQGNDIIGVDIDIMAAVAKKLDMELKVENINFDGLIPAVMSGKIQAIAAGMTVNEERKVNVSFSDPYTDAQQVVLIRKTSVK